MKNLFSTIFLFAVSIAGFSQNATSYADAVKSKKGTIICQYSETPGYITTNEKGAVSGLLPDIMNSYALHVKEKEGIDLKVSFVPVRKNSPITEIFSNVSNAGDGIFGLVFIFLTEERKKTLNVSSPIFESPTFLLTPQSAPEVTSDKEIAEKLKGYTAYVNKGNFYEDKFRELKGKHLPDMKLEYFQTYGVSNISETLNKEKSMQYVDISGYLHSIKNNLPFKNQKHLQFYTPMGIFFSKKNTWDDSFNKFLQSGYLQGVKFKKSIADNLGTPTLKFLKIGA
jgi:hypothetical protein